MSRPRYAGCFGFAAEQAAQKTDVIQDKVNLKFAAEQAAQKSGLASQNLNN